MSSLLASINTPYTLQSATTTGSGTVMTFPARGKDLVVYVTGAGTISSGTLVIEEASSPTYSGTWSSIQSVTCSDVTGGATKAYHISGKYAHIRARFSVDVGGGGTVSAIAVVADA